MTTLAPAEMLAKKLKTKAKDPGTKLLRKRTWNCTINKRRELLGLTLQQIGRATGVSPAILSNISNGTDLRLTTAVKIAKFFGCFIEELWPDLRGDK